MHNNFATGPLRPQFLVRLHCILKLESAVEDNLELALPNPLSQLDEPALDIIEKHVLQLPLPSAQQAGPDQLASSG